MKENFTSFFSEIALQNSFLLIMSTSEKVLKFTASVRGFHYYQRIWSPKKVLKLTASVRGFHYYQRIWSPKKVLKLTASVRGFHYYQRIWSPKKVLKLTASVRGFHYYQRIWSPKKGEKLNCYHERNNAFDIFAIKTESENGSTVGHLPREISRITKFILDRGAKITAILSSTNYRRSPLVQGGLEIACEITVKMPATIKSHMILDRYKELINDYYIEPKDE